MLSRLNSRLYRISLTRMISVINEPILKFIPGSDERLKLEKAIQHVKSQTVEIPIVIGGKKLSSSDIRYQVSPYEHQRKIAKFSYANKEMIEKAIEHAVSAQREWDLVPLEERIKPFMRVADRISGDDRYKLLAATMVGQGKTIVQAEIDAAAELIDFLRFNCKYALDLKAIQPIDAPDATNRSEYRGLEGFVASICPFNFTAISGNLATAPAIMGCATLWKPPDTGILASWLLYEMLLEEGVPENVIQFIPCDGPVFGDAVTQSYHLAAINFTGSTKTFKQLWKTVANRIDGFRAYPRVIGECGGKNFHFIHPSFSDLESIIGATVRSAFEYQGQKCSACSRMYVPQSMWSKVRDRLVEETKKIVVGPADDGKTFVSAVIDNASFKRLQSRLSEAKTNKDYNVLVGGECDDSVGYFIQPTIVEVSDPKSAFMQEEMFGPILTIYPYPDSEVEATMKLINETSPYSLTGSIFAHDEKFLEHSQKVLRNACGNMYLNDKCTGSVVAQQPFGGGRLSGTNDKAGSPGYMQRWTSPLSVKTGIGSRAEWRYPSMN